MNTDSVQADFRLVMASSDTQHVVVNSQSVDGIPSIDGHAQQSNSIPAFKGVLQNPPTSDTNSVAIDPSSTISQHARQQVSPAASLNGHGSLVEHGSAADTGSVHGSLAEVDSARDAGSVADAFDTGIGSDTDTSRADGTEQLKDANGNLRLAASKKPTSFKSVAVTKNFLAKTASVAPTAKPGEKG